MSFTSHNVTPPSVIDETSFTRIPKDCQLYVPSSSIYAYKAATGWKYFAKVSAIEDGGVNTIGIGSPKVTIEDGVIRIVGAECAVAEAYSLGGVLLYRGTDTSIELPRGVYIVKVAGTTTKVIL